MAVGLDRSLPSRSPQAFAAPAPAPMQRQAAAPLRPPAIADSAVQAAANNQRAAGYGARELTLADSDRRGLSRGKGQQYAARMAQEAADAKSGVAAIQTEMAAADANARARQAYDATMAGERQETAGLLEGLRSTAAAERLAARSRGQDAYEAIRRGQFGLDQQQLDYTPLLQQLFG